MKTPVVIFIFILVVISFSCFSQSSENSKIDSLKNLLISQKDDSIKVNALIEIGTSYLVVDNNEALKYGNHARDLAKKVSYGKGLGFALKLLGLGNVYHGNYWEADVQFKAALDVFERIHFKDGISTILNNLGSLYFSLGDDVKAIEYHLQSLKIAEEIGNKYRISTNLNNIGTIYANKPATHEKAIDYFLRALPALEELNYSDGIGTVTVNIGEIYFRKGMYDSALIFFNTSMKVYAGTADAALPLSYIGQIYAEQNDFDNALKYHDQAVAITERLGAQQYLAQSLLSLAKTQMRKGDVVKSIGSYKKALAISEEINARQEIKNSYEALADGYAGTGDFKNAYKYEALLMSMKDTLSNIDEDRKIQQLRFNFDLDKMESQLQLQSAAIQRQKIISYSVGLFFIAFLTVGVITIRFFQIRKTKRIIEKEKARSESLLLNILPKSVADELKANGESQARNFEEVTVLFTDFKDFTSIAEKLTPQELVAEINECFKVFDQIITRYSIEKIKTIGDSYMAAGGLESKNSTTAYDVVNAGLEMQKFMVARAEELRKQGKPYFEMRAGIHTGPVVAGIVGVKKFQYDIWGDTVNTASRMETSGQVGKVNISHHTYELIKDHRDFTFEPRGKVEAKNMGSTDMYFVSKLND